MSRRRSWTSPRPPRGAGEWAAAVVVAAVVLGALRQVARAALSALPAAGLLAAGALAAGGVVALARRGRVRALVRLDARRLSGVRLSLAAIDVLDPTAFERAVRDLMVRDGIDARHVGRRGDQGADVLGRDGAGRVFVAQCKHTTVGGRVSVRVIYEVKGTAGPVHRADTAIVVTNGGFTRDARVQAAALGIHLVDRERLRAWAEDGVSLRAVLR